MPERTKTIYVIAGCNGAGKTTFAREYLPHEVKCLRFLNADELARGLSPLDPAAGAFKAGRLLLREVRESISKGLSASQRAMDGLGQSRAAAKTARILADP